MTKKRAAKIKGANRSPAVRLNRPSVPAHKSMPDSTADSTPAKRPVIPSATSAERPLVNSKIMAFRCGRLVNEFRFHLLQAFLLHPFVRSDPDPAAWDEFELANNVIASLVQQAVLITATGSGDLISTLENIRINLLMGFGRAEHQEFLDRLGVRESLEGEDYPRDYWRDQKLWEGPSYVANLRNALLHYVAVSDRYLFYLGELIDQGIRPANIEVRVRELPGKSEQSKLTDNTANKGADSNDEQAGDLENFEIWECECVAIKPGDLVPEQAWLDAIKFALEGIGRTDLSKELQLEKHAAPGSFLETVDRLNSAIQCELADGSVTPKSNIPLNQAERKILTVLARTNRRLTESEILRGFTAIGVKEPASGSMKEALVRLQLRNFIDNDRDELGRGYLLRSEVRTAIDRGNICLNVGSQKSFSDEPRSSG